MFYLFILESIGTSELMLIGLVALIVFGPRKLPELARMLGKAKNEFLRTTDDFKQTWAREVDFELDIDDEKPKPNSLSENSIQRNEVLLKNEIVAPEIKELSAADFRANYPEKDIVKADKSINNQTDKRDWL